MIYVSCSGRWLGQRARWCSRISGGADELGNAVELVLVEVIDQAVAQELARHEQRGLHVRWATTSMGG